MSLSWTTKGITLSLVSVSVTEPISFVGAEFPPVGAAKSQGTKLRLQRSPTPGRVNSTFSCCHHWATRANTDSFFTLELSVGMPDRTPGAN